MVLAMMGAFVGCGFDYFGNGPLNEACVSVANEAS